MKFYFGILLILGVFCSCDRHSSPSLEGTWQLISATSTEKDSTFSTFNSKVKMIKIINTSHFAFLSHDITGAKDSTRAVYTAGGGT